MPRKSGFMDIGLDLLQKLRSDLTDTVFLGLLACFFQYFFDRFAPGDRLTPAGQVDFAAFQNQCHGASLFLRLQDAPDISGRLQVTIL